MLILYSGGARPSDKGLGGGGGVVEGGLQHFLGPSGLSLFRLKIRGGGSHGSLP